MYLPLVATTLLLAVSTSASPLRRNLLPRQGKCSAIATADMQVGDKTYTLTGPFQLMAMGDFDKSGYYANFGQNTDVPQIIFDVTPARQSTDATGFYLNKAGHVVTIVGDDLYRSYVTGFDTGNLDDQNVIMSTEVGHGNKLLCTMDATSCAMSCAVDSNAFQCLGSPGYQPDWRIGSDKASSGIGCAEINVMAVPM